MRKFVALMAAAVMLFAFCASANAATQVTIWHTFTDAQQAALEKFAAAITRWSLSLRLIPASSTPFTMPLRTALART